MEFTSWRDDEFVTEEDYLQLDLNKPVDVVRIDFDEEVRIIIPQDKGKKSIKSVKRRGYKSVDEEVIVYEASTLTLYKFHGIPYLLSMDILG